MVSMEVVDYGACERARPVGRTLSRSFVIKLGSAVILAAVFAVAVVSSVEHYADVQTQQLATAAAEQPASPVVLKAAAQAAARLTSLNSLVRKKAALKPSLPKPNSLAVLEEQEHAALSQAYAFSKQTAHRLQSEEKAALADAAAAQATQKTDLAKARVLAAKRKHVLLDQQRLRGDLDLPSRYSQTALAAAATSSPASSSSLASASSGDAEEADTDSTTALAAKPTAHSARAPLSGRQKRAMALKAREAKAEKEAMLLAESMAAQKEKAAAVRQARLKARQHTLDAEALQKARETAAASETIAVHGNEEPNQRLAHELDEKADALVANSAEMQSSLKQTSLPAPADQSWQY